MIIDGGILKEYRIIGINPRSPFQLKDALDTLETPVKFILFGRESLPFHLNQLKQSSPITVVFYNCTMTCDQFFLLSEINKAKNQFGRHVTVILYSSLLDLNFMDACFDLGCLSNEYARSEDQMMQFLFNLSKEDVALFKLIFFGMNSIVNRKISVRNSLKSLDKLMNLVKRHLIAPLLISYVKKFIHFLKTLTQASINNF